MSVEVLENVIFDKENKIWKSAKQPDKDFCEQSLGEAFLKYMRQADKNQILDYFYDNGISKTAQEIYEESIKIAINLKRLGIEKNDVIILYSSCNEWSSVLAMGSILAGAQVNFFDILFDTNNIDALFGIVQPSIILYEEKQIAHIKQSLKRKPLNNLKHMISIDGDGDFDMNLGKQLLSTSKKLSSEDFDSFQAVSIKNPQSEICCLLFTAGTTALSKVVKLTHSQLMYGLTMLWEANDITNAITAISYASLAWVTQILVLFHSIIIGSKRVSCNGTLSASYGKNIMQKCGITNLIITPLFLQGILQELSENDTDTLKCLQYVLLGGDLATKTVKDLIKPHCPQAKYFMRYGITEMVGGIAMDNQINGGKLFPGYQIMILDDNQKPLGPNARGQIVMKFPYPSFGYKGLSSANCFTKENFFMSGDYGFVDEKCNLHLLGRCKYLIRSEKVTLQPYDIELPLLQLPEVQSAYVIGYKESNEARHEIACLFIVLKSGIELDPSDMRLKIQQKLISYLSAEKLSAIKDIHFIQSVPLTICGKSDRQALQKKAMELCKAQIQI